MPLFKHFTVLILLKCVSGDFLAIESLVRFFRAALAVIAGGGGAAAVPSGGGDPNNVPCARRGATAMANAVAVFARMDAFVRWRVGGSGDNGGGNVIALAA